MAQDIITIDSAYVGFPCFKPIIRSLKNTSYIPQFEKTVFCILKSEGFSDDDALDILFELQGSSLYGNCPTFTADFFFINGEHLDRKGLLPALLSEDIPFENSCVKYYESFHSNCNACLACPRSPKFSNKYLREELSILKFIMASEDNYNFAKELLLRNSIEFTSVYDVTYDLCSERAYYLPLNKWIYTIISSLGEAFFFPQMIDEPEIRFNYILQDFEKYMIDASLPPTFITKEGWMSIVLRRALKRIDSSKDLSRDDVCSLINTIKASFESQTSEPEPLVVPILGSDSVDLHTNNSELNPPLLDISFSVDAIEPAHDTSSDEANTENSDESVTDIEDDNSIVQPIEQDFQNDCYTLTVYNTKKHFVVTSSSEWKYTPADYYELPEVLTPSLTMEYVFKRNALMKFKPVSNNNIELATIENFAVKNKSLPVEVICNEDGRFLLVLYANNIYYQMDFDNEIAKNIVKELLERKGIRKVCYHPYLLYSFCYNFDISVRNVHSILTYHKFLYPDTNVVSIDDLVLFYKKVNHNELYDRLRNSSGNNLRLCMRHYCHTAKQQLIECKDKTISPLMKMQSWDEVLGSSYMLCRFMRSSKRFFIRKDAYYFSFDNNAYLETRDAVLYSGYYATYKLPKWFNKKGSGILTDTLCQLSVLNYFKKYNLLLVNFALDHLLFYIAEEEFSMLDTVITVELRKMAKVYGVENLYLDTAYEYMPACI